MPQRPVSPRLVKGPFDRVDRYDLALAVFCAEAIPGPFNAWDNRPSCDEVGPCLASHRAPVDVHIDVKDSIAASGRRRHGPGSQLVQCPTCWSSLRRVQWHDAERLPIAQGGEPGGGEPGGGERR